MKFGLYAHSSTSKAIRCIDGIFTLIDYADWTSRDAVWQHYSTAPGTPLKSDVIIPKLQNSGSLHTYCRNVAKTMYGVPDDVELYSWGDWGVELSSALYNFRQSCGLTQKALAEQTGINIRQIQKIEKGEIKIDNITLKNAIALADALGIDDLRVFLTSKNGEA